MHKSYRTVSCLLAGAVLLTGSAITSNAMGMTKTVKVPAYQLSQNLVAETIQQKVAVSQEITPEKAEAVKMITTVEESVGAEIENTAVSNVNDYVNIRQSADENSEAVGKLYSESVATVEGEENGWYKIQSGSVEGYVKADYLIVGDAEAIQSASQTVATVNTSTLKVREQASTDAAVVTLVGEGQDLEITQEEENGWIAVSTSEGDGYVSAEYVEVSTKYKEAVSKEEEEAAAAAEEANRGLSVAAYAGQFVGNPYVWGGTSLTNGADCSGFVMSVYAHFGISLPHSSAAMRGVGRAVDRSEIQPGDIVCYSGHVGIYAGNNTLVHAANERSGIKYTSGIDYRPIVAIRRVL